MQGELERRRRNARGNWSTRTDSKQTVLSDLLVGAATEYLSNRPTVSAWCPSPGHLVGA